MLVQLYLNITEQDYTRLTERTSSTGFARKVGQDAFGWTTDALRRSNGQNAEATERVGILTSTRPTSGLWRER